VNSFLELALKVAEDAGREVLAVWSKRLSFETKVDGSPITVADRKSHDLILQALSVSGLPIVSEEADDMSMNSTDYWLVDPLDGTKEFIAGNPEFTINIARVRDEFPVLGVVVAPALGQTFIGSRGEGAWLIDARGKQRLLALDRAPACRIAVSRFHDHPGTELFIARNSITQRIEIGSALKYGYLAASRVDVFPRLVGCYEWDTAAGQAVLEEAGGSVVEWSTGRRLRYGKPRRRNAELISFRAPYSLSDFRLECNEGRI